MTDKQSSTLAGNTRQGNLGGHSAAPFYSQTTGEASSFSLPVGRGAYTLQAPRQPDHDALDQITNRGRIVLIDIGKRGFALPFVFFSFHGGSYA